MPKVIMSSGKEYEVESVENIIQLDKETLCREDVFILLKEGILVKPGHISSIETLD